jgi:hypothetical protein
MTLPRALLVLIFLPTILPAAPAPLPRQKRTPDGGGWSGTVNGLRVRLTARQGRYLVGDTVRLVLEIQNASDRARTIEAPDLSHSIRGPESARDGWSITSERKAGKGELRREHLRVLREGKQRGSEFAKLRAGETLRIEIDAATELRQHKLALRRGDEARKEQLYYPDAAEPGTYELRASFRPSPRAMDDESARTWPGQALKTPPVRIVIQK